MRTRVSVFILGGLLCVSVSAQACDAWRSDEIRVKAKAQQEKVDTLKENQLKKLKVYERQAKTAQKLIRLLQQPQKGPFFDMESFKRQQTKALAAYNKSLQLFEDVKFDSKTIEKETELLEALLVSACKRQP